MPTPIEITNVALGMIGEDPINSFQNDLDTARAANLRYPTVRDAILRDHFWNFAMARRQLAALATPPDFGFISQFQLPADFIRMFRVEPQDGDTISFRHELHYQIEGGKLLANIDPIRIKYVRREDDTTKWDAMATEALAARLASELAISVTQSRELQDQLWRISLEKLAEARSVDVLDEPANIIEASSWTESRFRAGGRHLDHRFHGNLF